MKNYVITGLLFLLLAPAFSANGNGQGGNQSMAGLTVQIMNQTHLMSQIQTALQSQLRTQLMIGQTNVTVESGRITVQAQEQNRITVSSDGVSVEDMNVSSGLTVAIQVQARIMTGAGTQNMNVTQEQNMVQLNQEGTDVNVTLQLNQRIMIQNQTMYMNMSGTLRELTVLPIQAMNQAMVRNQSRVYMELGVENSTPQYRIREEKQVRIIGIFPANMNVSTSVNAENGNVLNVEKPWWSFIAVE